MRGHTYTIEQDEFIRNNYLSVGKCLQMFNDRFGTKLSYSALKTHALRIGVKTNFRPWTDEMNTSLEALLKKHPYKIATGEFNKKHGMSFTKKQIQNHCTNTGITRDYRAKLNEIDKIITDNINKPYKDIMNEVNSRLSTEYKSCSTICRRANNAGLSRPHRVWSVNDKRTVAGEPVTFAEYVRYIGNRWHRLPCELQGAALMVIKLQAQAYVSK